MKNQKIILLNNRGEALLSVLMASGFLLLIFMVSIPAIFNSYSSQKKKIGNPLRCQEVAQNIMNEIRSNGLQTKVYRAPIQASSVRLNDSQWQNNKSPDFGTLNSGGVLPEHGVGEALFQARFPDEPIMAWSAASGHFVANSPYLIYSSMNFLQAVNNSFGNQACSQTRGLQISSSNGLDSLLPSNIIDGYRQEGLQVSASMKIQPFKLLTGQLESCQSNLRLRPQGNEEPPRIQNIQVVNGSSIPTTEKVADFSNFRSDLGFEVEVFAQVDHVETSLQGSDSLTQCSVKEKFQYDRILTNIPKPVVSISASSTSVSLPSGFLPGLFLACWASHSHYYSSSNSFSSTSSSGWIPCDQIKICGSSVSPVVTDNQSDLRISYNYSIPSSCLMSLRVMAFDSIGNTSDVSSQNYFQGSSTPGPGGQATTGSNTNTAYEVAGTQFGSYQAAQQAASLTGQSIRSVSGTGSFANDANMSSFSSSINSAQVDLAVASAQTSAVNTTSNYGANVSAASSNVAAANAAVATATAAQSAAASAQKSASNITGGQVGAAAQKQADEAKAAADKAVADAQAALQAALDAEKAAKEEAERQKDDD